MLLRSDVEPNAKNPTSQSVGVGGWGDPENKGEKTKQKQNKEPCSFPIQSPPPDCQRAAPHPPSSPPPPPASSSACQQLFISFVFLYLFSGEPLYVFAFLRNVSSPGCSTQPVSPHLSPIKFNPTPFQNKMNK